jgi:hypothetical protein
MNAPLDHAVCIGPGRQWGGPGTFGPGEYNEVDVVDAQEELQRVLEELGWRRSLDPFRDLCWPE